MIPHGAFEHLTRLPDERPLPPELAEVEGPVVLCFGVVRPYKGVDVLLEAFRAVEGAELWVVGRPLGVDDLEAGAAATVRFVTRYVSDAELPAFFRRADLLVLPHRNVDVSGRAVRRPGLRQADGAVATSAAFASSSRTTAPGGSCRPATRRRSPAAIGELLADPAERERARRACRARRPRGRSPGTRSPHAPSRSTTRCWAR